MVQSMAKEEKLRIFLSPALSSSGRCSGLIRLTMIEVSYRHLRGNWNPKRLTASWKECALHRKTVARARRLVHTELANAEKHLPFMRSAALGKPVLKRYEMSGLVTAVK